MITVQYVAANRVYKYKTPGAQLFRNGLHLQNCIFKFLVPLVIVRNNTYTTERKKPITEYAALVRSPPRDLVPTKLNDKKEL